MANRRKILKRFPLLLSILALLSLLSNVEVQAEPRTIRNFSNRFRGKNQETKIVGASTKTNEQTLESNTEKPISEIKGNGEGNAKSEKKSTSKRLYDYVRKNKMEAAIRVSAVGLIGAYVADLSLHALLDKKKDQPKKESTANSEPTANPSQVSGTQGKDQTHEEISKSSRPTATTLP